MKTRNQTEKSQPTKDDERRDNLSNLAIAVASVSAAFGQVHVPGGVGFCF